MTQDEFNNLREGDIVQGKGSGQAYIVTANYGGRVTAVRTADITYPAEWDVVEPQPKSLAEPIQFDLDKVNKNFRLGGLAWPPPSTSTEDLMRAMKVQRAIRLAELEVSIEALGAALSQTSNPATIAARLAAEAGIPLDPETVAKSEAYCDATGIERNVQTALRSGMSQDDRLRFFMDAPARMTPPLPAAGFMNLGIKASAFVEALNDLCHAHGVQIKSFSPVLVIMNLAHNEEPIDFPEIQDRT